jgi:hypothetical protein
MCLGNISECSVNAFHHSVYDAVWWMWLASLLAMQKLLCSILSGLNSLMCNLCVLFWQQPNPAKRKYQIHLKSHSGPIYVLLVNKDSDGSSPVVVQVPPPKEEMEMESCEPVPTAASVSRKQAAAKVFVFLFSLSTEASVFVIRGIDASVIVGLA